MRSTSSATSRAVKRSGTRVRHISAGVATVVIVFGVAACGGKSSSPAINATALDVHLSPIPRLNLPGYRTTGAVPQVSAANEDMTAVNTALRATLVAAERTYSTTARKAMAKWPRALRVSVLKRYHGVYEMSPQPRLISASTVVVSVLVPVLELLPGGTDGETWISTTLRVPSGSRIGIPDLFNSPSQGLASLANAVRPRLLSANSCVRSSLNSPLNDSSYIRGLEPNAKNYRYFSLTTHGMAIGFPVGQVASPSCGRVKVVVPYRLLRPYMSALGREMTAGVRMARLGKSR
jgi:hypothetical protein